MLHQSWLRTTHYKIFLQVQTNLGKNWQNSQMFDRRQGLAKSAQAAPNAISNTPQLALNDLNALTQ